MINIRRRFQISCKVQYKDAMLRTLYRHNVTIDDTHYHGMKIGKYGSQKVYYECNITESDLTALIAELNRDFTIYMGVTLTY